MVYHDITLVQSMGYEQWKKARDGTEPWPGASHRDSALVAGCFPIDPAGALGDRGVPRGYFLTA